MPDCLVKVLPDCLEVKCVKGARLLEVIAEVGIQLEAPCGCKGVCGKCRVRIVDGMSNILTAPTSRLTAADQAAGMVLACQTKVEGDITVEIPPASRLSNQKILTAGTNRAVVLEAAIRKIYVEVAEATILEPLADWERFINAVKAAECEIDRKLNHLTLRKLPELLRANKGKVTAVVADGAIIDAEPGDTSGTLYGAAFDIGTTTVVGYLVDLLTGEELAVASRMNPQVIYGDDVISRINVTIEKPDGLQKLHEAVIGAMNDIISELCEAASVEQASIYEVTVVGNTCMSHLVAAVGPKYLGLYPYTASFAGAMSIGSRELGIGINGSGRIYLLPNVASFVGADTVGVMLAVDAASVSEPTLMIDIGTNGEIVMAKDGKLWTSSCAAGPAFEGGHISCGMRATQGAIDKVIIGEKLVLSTIGGTSPKGICGSGLIDALAELLRKGLVDMTGRFVDLEELPAPVSESVKRRLVEDGKDTRFVLAFAGESAHGEEVAITQKDLRELQLIKGAIYAGCKILLDVSGTKDSDLGNLLLAGAFGNYIDRVNALHIGLIPSVSVDKVVSVGNAAGVGAKIALRSVSERVKAETMARTACFVELANRNDFQDEYMNAMFFNNAIC